MISNLALPSCKQSAYLCRIEIFRLDNIDLKLRNCPSARSASAVNAIGSDTDMFSGSSISINDLLVFSTVTREN